MEEEFFPYRRLVPDLREVPGCRPWEVFEGTVGRRRVAIVVSDCGPANAAAALERVVARFEPDLVLSGGSAGSHDPGLLPGDVVVGARYRILVPLSIQEERRRLGRHQKGFRFRRDGRRHHPRILEAPAELLSRAVAAGRDELRELGAWAGPGWPEDVERRPGKVVAGLVGSADTWTTREEDVRGLRELYGSDCEDMESAYLAQLCALHGLPFVSIRTVSNNELRGPLAARDTNDAISLAGERSARIVARIAANEAAGRGAPLVPDR
jgi:adenosylhomocysteine nucleosidase